MKKTFYILPRILLITWLLSVALFFLVAIKFEDWKHYSNFMGIDVVVGIVLFILTIIATLLSSRYEKVINIKSQTDFTKLLKSPIVIIIGLFVVFLLGTGVLGAKYIISNNKTEANPSQINYPTATKEPMNDIAIFDEVNDYRKSKNLSVFNWDNESCKIAGTILENDFWNTDYNVNNYKSECPNCSDLSIAQAKDISSTSSLISLWEADQLTLKTLNSSATNTCARTKDGKVVLVVSKKNTPTTKTLTTTSTDPIVTCNINPNCGGGTRQMKQSECNQSTCCQIGNNWSMYPSKTICTQAQNNYYSVKSGTSANNYPPCTVYYPVLGYSQTYNYISPAQCLSWQTTANSYNTAPTTVYVPIPTEDPAYQDLLNQHAEACRQAVSEWTTIVEEFYATEYNNFSSSYEAQLELESRRQTYQQELYNAGCNQTIYL